MSKLFSIKKDGFYIKIIFLGIVISFKRKIKIKFLSINLNDKIYKKKLAIYFDSGIGDYLMLRHFLPHIRDYYFDYQITFIGNNRFKDLVLHFDKEYIDEYIYYIDKYDHLEFKYFFDNLEYDILISHYFLRTSVKDKLISMIHSKEKISTFGGLIAMNLKERSDISMYTKVIYSDNLNGDMFELDRNKEFFEKLLNKKINIDSINFNLLDEEYKNIDFNFNQRYVVIFPTSTSILKDWDYKNFYYVANYISIKYNLIVYILGPYKDRKIGYKISNQSKYIISLFGKYSINEVPYITSKAKLVLSCDTGGAHIGIATSNNNIVISNGSAYIRFLNYPKYYKKDKNVSIVLPPLLKDDILKGNNHYIEYFHSKDNINSITPDLLCCLIDRKYSNFLNT